MSASPAASTPVHPAPLSGSALAELRRRLIDMAAQLDAREAGLRERLAEPPSEFSNAFIAGSEAGLAAEAQDEVIAQLAHEDGLLAEVKQALDRMDQGQYGDCQDCGETIDAARLDAVPWATHCLGCQDRAEKLKLRLRA
jgi:DnaK suppressor protein